MSVTERIRDLFGISSSKSFDDHPLIARLARSLDETRALSAEVREMRESGNWLRDTIMQERKDERLQ